MEKAEVRHVDGVKLDKSHGDEEADDGAEEETVDENDPRELCRLPARFLATFGERSLLGKTRHIWPCPISLRPRIARVNPSGRPCKRDSSETSCS